MKWFSGGVLQGENVSRFTIHDGDYPVAEVVKRFGEFEDKDAGDQHAALITQAPALLEACKMMVGVCEGFPDIANEPSVKQCMDWTRKAIEAAEGRLS
jgi:hypothetical protein